MTRDLGIKILTGEDAIEAFDADRYAEEMRKQNALAIARLNELLIWLKGEHDGTHTSGNSAEQD